MNNQKLWDALQDVSVLVTQLKQASNALYLIVDRLEDESHDTGKAAAVCLLDRMPFYIAALNTSQNMIEDKLTELDNAVETALARAMSKPEHHSDR